MMGKLLYDILLFDADNTLYDFDACEKIAFRRALDAAGISYAEGMTETYSEINVGCWKRFERGEITRKELTRLRYALFLERYGIAFDALALNDLYVGFLSEAAILLPGAEDLIRRLSAEASIYIITNGLSRVQHGRFDRSPLTPYVKDVFISEELGANKPDKLYFDRVIARIPGFDRARAVVIGDSLTSDIKGANNAGLHAVWYDRSRGRERPDGQVFDARVTDYRELLRFLYREGEET